MKTFNYIGLLTFFLIGTHATFNFKTQLEIEKKDVSEDVPLTEEDFQNGAKIILTAPDKKQLLPFDLTDDIIREEENELESFAKRAYVNRLWDKGIVPYEVGSSFTGKERAAIARAIQEFNELTCVRWIPKTNERDYAFFFKSDRCNSKIGKLNGCQLILLNSDCGKEVLPILHEMMHTIGFVHEQNRPDRDSYVNIKPTNIKLNGEKNFQIDKNSKAVMSYDFNSIMHYNAYAFSKNRDLPTIIPKDRSKIIQRGPTFSKLDLAKIKKVYNC